MTNTIPLDGEQATVREDRDAVGGAAARPGHPQHPRGDVGIVVVRVDGDLGSAAGRGARRPRAREARTEGMEARLEAVKRDTKGKNEARRLRVAGRIPAVAVRRRRRADGKPQATPIAVDPKALIGHPALRVGREHPDQPEGRATRTCKVLVQGVPARPGHAASCCTPTSTASRWTRCSPSRCRSRSRARRRASSSRAASLDFVHREIEIECLPADIPEHIEIDVTELMLGQAIRLRDVATDPKWKAGERSATSCSSTSSRRARWRSRGGCRGRGGRAGDGGRARGHQEGQGREGEDEKGEEA